MGKHVEICVNMCNYGKLGVNPRAAEYHFWEILGKRGPLIFPPKRDPRFFLFLNKIVKIGESARC